MKNAQLPEYPMEQKDFVEVVDFVFVCREKAIQAKADGGGINWMDAAKALELIQPGAVAADGADHILPNLAAASPDERRQTIEYIAAKYNLGYSVAERRALKAVKIAADVYALFTDDDADDATANA